MYAMPSRRFLRFAWRIAAYGGMLTRRVEAQAESAESEPAPVEAPQRESRARPTGRVDNLTPQGAKVVSAAELAFLHPGIVEIRKASASE